MPARGSALLLAIVFLTLATSCSAQPRPVPTGTHHTYYGNIDNGAEFGVRIGDDRASVARALTRDRFYHLGVDTCLSTAKELMSCQASDKVDYYHVDEFLKFGSVLIIYKDDRVNQIAWSFRLFNTIV